MLIFQQYFSIAHDGAGKRGTNRAGFQPAEGAGMEVATRKEAGGRGVQGGSPHRHISSHHPRPWWPRLGPSSSCTMLSGGRRFEAARSSIVVLEKNSSLWMMCASNGGFQACRGLPAILGGAHHVLLCRKRGQAARTKLARRKLFWRRPMCVGISTTTSACGSARFVWLLTAVYTPRLN